MSVSPSRPPTKPSGIGKVPIQRGFLNDPQFGEGREFSEAEAWLWIVDAAAFTEHEIGIDGNLFTLRPGQMSHSLRYMQRAWGWRSDKAVRSFLKRCRRCGKIDFKAIKFCPKTDAWMDAGGRHSQTLITIKDYAVLYAFGPGEVTGTDASTDALGTHSGRIGDANKKKGKKVEKVEKGKEGSSPAGDEGVVDVDFADKAEAFDLGRRILGAEKRSLVGQGLKLLGSPGAVIDALHAAHGKDNPAAYFSAIVRNGRAVADAGLTHADLEWYGRWKEERRIIGAWDGHYPPQDVQARYRDIGAKLDAMPADQAERLLAGEEAKANKKADPTHRDSKAGK